MPYLKFSGIAAFFCMALLFLGIPFSVGQTISATENDAEPTFTEPYAISVNVNEIRLDVVVLDKKGNPITDLTADDFEVYQDGLPQEVKAGVYIGNQAKADVSPGVSRKAAPNLIRIPVTTLEKEEVCRTIVFIVDNNSMRASHLQFAKMSVNRFLEKQMQPCDMAAVMQTGFDNSALNFFSSDKRLIAERVNNIALAGFIPGPFEKAEFEETKNPAAFRKLYAAALSRVYGSQISTVSYGIRVLKDMPGRKIIFMLSSRPAVEIDAKNLMTTNDEGMKEINFDNPSDDNSERYGGVLNRLADEALRAGVVFHTLDARGQCAPKASPNGAPQGLTPNNTSDMTEEEPCPIESMYADGMNKLSYKTGGIFVQDSNFFLDGVGKKANNMIAGYYLVSYVPPQSVFDLDRRGNEVFHRVQVNVKRKGLEVYTRDGFYGRIESKTDSGAKNANSLADAIFSPFRNADLNVNITAGYIKGPKSGNTTGTQPEYLLRSWIHLDTKDVTIVEKEDGSAAIELETVCLTSDINGDVQDSRGVKYIFGFEPGNNSENIEWIREHGIRFTLLLPVKKPGVYTVYIAVKDTESGKIGSAYQFIEIPELKKKSLEMSSIFILTSAEDLAWMNSDVIKETAQGMFFPVLRKDNAQSPALRTYAPGDGFQTLAMLYNADKKAVDRSEIEIQSFIYRDGREFVHSEPKPVTPDKVKTPDSIAFLQKMTVNSDMPPGNYMLQLLATDKNNSEKRDDEGVAEGEKDGIFSRIMRSYFGTEKEYKKDKGIASQIMGFTVVVGVNE